MSATVSIICSSYNYGRFVGETIRSVLGQGFQAWELIVIDDLSDDDSAKVIQSFSDPRITFIQSPERRGLARSFEAAYAQSRGDLIMNLDSDDLLSPEQLQRQVGIMSARPELGVLGTYLREIDTEGKPVGGAGAFESWFNHRVDFNAPASWTLQNRVPNSGTLIRRSVRERLNGFNGELEYTCDYDFWLRAVAAGIQIEVLPEALTLYRGHGSNLTHRDPVRKLLEIVYIYLAGFAGFLESSGSTDLLSDWTKAILSEPSFPALAPLTQYRLMNLISQRPLRTPGNWSAFTASLESPATDEETRNAPLIGQSTQVLQHYSRLSAARQDWITQLEGAKAFHLGQIKNLENALANEKRCAETAEALRRQERGRFPTPRAVLSRLARKLVNRFA